MNSSTDNTEAYYSGTYTNTPELDEGKTIPWWRRGPNAGLISFGQGSSETFGGRPPDGVGCWIIGRICAYLDKEVGELVEDLDERERLKARAVRAMERLEKPLLEPLRAKNRVRSRYRIISFAEIKPAPTEMIINPILPRGEVTILDGDPDAGKSWLWMALLAGLTGSKVCPLPEPLNNGASEIQSALILTTEDDPAKTIRPRLDYLGADPKRIKIVQRRNAEEMFFTATDARDIAQLIKETTPDIVIIDPLTLYASTEQGFDSNKATSVRRMLTPLIKVARETNCAFLVNRHFRKTSGKAMHQGIGSIDYAATARSMIMVVKDQADPSGNPRIVSHFKSNLTERMREGLMFSLDKSQTPPFQWEGVCEVNPDELTDYEGACNARDDRSKLGEAVEFLRQILADGPMSVQEVQRQAAQFLISERTLRRAREKLGVVAEQTGGGFSDEKKVWIWRLP